MWIISGLSPAPVSSPLLALSWDCGDACSGAATPAFTSFDPGSSDNAALQHLLWVRCHKAFDAIKAADLLLRDGNFPLVIVDLVLNTPDELRKIQQTSWYRLQRLVEAVPTACLIINRQGMVASAQLKIVLDNSWTLGSLENENTMSDLRFPVQRSHVKSLVTRPLSLVT